MMLHEIPSPVGRWFDPVTSKEIPHTKLLKRLAGKQVVLMGENHDQADIHRWQLHVATGLLAHRPDLTMQPILIAPVSRYSIVNGYLLAGLVRGMFACAIVALASLLLFGVASLPLTFPALIGLLLTMIFFALAGLLAGLLIKDFEDIAVITNFIIMPMAFFSGTFFPLDHIPALLRIILNILPLTQANLLLRSQSFSGQTVGALCLLIALCAITYGAAWICLNRYQE